ncbi:hypothetical protein G7Y79_00017g042210 [Physcia stellaris]|nr:hypothetical protein G7Y79_00017g042210 [Physcia stellaris]
MIVNNTDQADPTRSARSVSMSQNIPPLCPGAAYRLFWTNRITINNYNRKRAPVDNQNCTVGFDLLDQGISVMGGPNGAPLPYTQTTSGDIFRYRGYLDHNTLSITLNCTADYGEYHIDNIFFVGPTGSCCSSVSSSATYNTTDYSLSTL